MTELVEFNELNKQIAEIKTTEDANLLRSKIEALEKVIHQVARDRETKFLYLYEAGQKYGEASSMAGELWALVENKATQGFGMEKRSKNFSNVISIEDAGFKNSVDATMCTRIAELDPQDRELYYEDCLTNKKIPTLHGLYRIWRELNPNTPEPIKGKYRVIYIDPPWHYGNLMPDYATMPETHYAPISDQRLMEMNIKEIADENAVMFIWTTSPKLEDSFKIIRAWGFEYKASFIWDKVKHNMGHYNSVRHEFLLVCIKGNCPPDTLKLYDSVQSIERSGAHSEKPDEFREMIDVLYPEGKRIEVFARKKSEGWDVYGNEV